MRRTEIRFLSRLLRQTMAGATEPRVFGRRGNGGDFCCVPGCSNQRGKDKVNGVKRSYYKFPLDQKRRNLWISAVKRADWVPRRWDFVCSDHFENGNLFFFFKTASPFQFNCVKKITDDSRFEIARQHKYLFTDIVIYRDNVVSHDLETSSSTSRVD